METQNQLSKQSNETDLKRYFNALLRLNKSNKEFPVNLDEVWMLVYSAKEKAVRALLSNKQFIQDVDYKVLTQKKWRKPQRWQTNRQLLFIPFLP